MASFIFDLFIILSYPSLVITILMMIVSGYLFFRRKGKKKVAYLHRYILFFPFICFLMYIFFIVNSLIIYKSEYVGSYEVPVELFVITLMNSINWAWLVIVWIWCHKRYVIYDDKFVHYRCFFGKQEIYYKDIDIEKSKYVFVAPPRYIGYASDDEVLRLTFKDGTTAKFTFYSYIWDEGIDDFTDVLWFDLKIERISDYSRMRKKKLRKKK